jgi:Rps23 Pro-64 3,4-dihydroxylase Tpa1-like proline 4-hydroxylase
MSLPNFAGAEVSPTPFPTIRVPAVLPTILADDVLRWFENGAPWSLKETEFYEQYEFSLLGTLLPPAAACLASGEFASSIASELRDRLNVNGRLEITEIAAHRLSPQQTIKMHNDYLSGEETHRLLIHLNAGWTAEMGGLLMLFAGERPEDVTDIIRPVHRSGFAFEISPHSYHAVSTIRSGDRYTVVYTFRCVR